MRSVIGEGDSPDSRAQQEKIFVAVRLRPLNEKELARNNVSCWECVNDTTILFRNTLHERSSTPTTYTFDRVFGGECSTRQVYEEAAAKTALSALNGINSTIFAYGQTSSGKTYTMSGITECAVADIFNYMHNHPEREFLLKFSALEIYNESVKDLLSPYSGPLRLLDDPEKGTVVDKLTEVKLRDSNHLYELLSVCEAHRRTGETALNELSSRSHQILRLTIENGVRPCFGVEKASSLSATVNFVDLAGSERASQTLSGGSRLKEGSHINRSLLTLGTVIRKLSKGRNGHIPYRDSKLTRILQNSLGGNARTAIICTLSPAQTHVEQSRNTLVFASCAKQVAMNAHVNVMMSEKALVKQLQSALTKMENELRHLRSLSASSVSVSALTEKESLIEKMEKEIREITYQRDLALSRVQSILQSGSPSQASKSSVDYARSETSEINDPHMLDVARSSFHHRSISDESLISNTTEYQPPENNEDQFFSGNISPTQYIDKYFGPDPSRAWEKLAEETRKKLEDNRKKVQCVVIDSTNTDLDSNIPSPQHGGQSPCSTLNIASSPKVNLSRSSSCSGAVGTITKSPSSKVPEGGKIASTTETKNEFIDYSDSGIPTDCSAEKEKNATLLDENTVDEQEEGHVKEVIIPEIVNPINQREMVRQDMVMDIEEERPATKPEPEVAEVVPVNVKDEKHSPNDDWSAEFQRKMKEIICLWDACHIPLVHRTYFFLLFKGDSSDAVYIEVELRRLTYLSNSRNGAAMYDPSSTQTSRAKALNREREMLSKRMLKKFSSKARDELYVKWGINLKSKQRRLQLCKKLWSNTTDMDHIKESAVIIARLVGFKEPAGNVSKEMIGLSFLPSTGSFSWRDSLPSMMQGLME